MIPGYVAHFIICALRKGRGVKKGPPVSVLSHVEIEWWLWRIGCACQKESAVKSLNQIDIETGPE